MKKVIVAIITCLLIITYMMPVNAFAFNNSDKVILIDPGHGGIDGGAKSKAGTIEKDINLQISLKLRDNLEEKGYKVYMTRDEDEGLYQKGNTIKEKKREDLNRRVQMKKETDCDIFVSIHLNKIPQQQYDGWQTFYNVKSTEGQKLAVSIQNSLNTAIQKENNRVAKSIDNVYIVKHVEIPITIVECGFLSNPEEEQKLLNDEYQNRLSWGIYNGIIDYFYDGNS